MYHSRAPVAAKRYAIVATEHTKPQIIRRPPGRPFGRPSRRPLAGRLAVGAHSNRPSSAAGWWPRLPRPI